MPLKVKSPYICPECMGKTARYQLTRSVSSATENRIRVQHREDCARWNAILRTFPNLVGDREPAVKLVYVVG